MIEVRQVDWPSARHDLEAIRRAVFIDEQRIAEADEWDGRDDDAVHFLALQAGQPVGTLRLLDGGQVGRVAVLASARRAGAGLALLQAAIRCARGRGDAGLWLNSQLDALPFYARAGFHPAGPTFMESGIAHRRMTLDLPIEFQPPVLPAEAVPVQSAVPPTAAAVPPARTDRPAGVLALAGEGAIRTALAAHAWRARRELRFYAQQLEPPLYDDADLVDAVSAVARRHPRALVRILIHDPSRIITRTHRLLELSRRLPSLVPIRTVPPELQAEESSMVVADDCGVLMLPDWRKPDGFVTWDDLPLARRLVHRFDQAWERAQHDPELRVLSI